MTIADRLGVPVAVMAVFGLAVWASIRWIGENVGVPLVQRHVRFLDENTAFQATLVKRMDEQGVLHTQNIQRLMDLHAAIQAKKCMYEPPHKPTSTNLT